MKNIFKRFKNWIKNYIYGILYIALLMILSGYIFVNWNKCISMKFFERFDGNNILFLVWIALLILSFYDIEAKGWKFRRKGIEETKNKFDIAKISYEQEQLNNMINSMQSQNLEERDGGDSQK